MAVPSPFQRTATDGEGVWASGMTHTHNELACCAIQYKKGKQKHKQQSRLAFIETVDTSNQETNWSSPGVCSTCHNNLLSHLRDDVARTANLKPIYFTCVNDRTVRRLYSMFLKVVG